MKRSLKRAAFAVPAMALLLVASVGSWYAFSAPPVENLPLASDLIAISSAEGRQLLAATPLKTDYHQLEPFLLPQVRRAFCGPATSAAVINAALRPRTRVTQSSLFDTATSAVKSELAVSFGGLTLEELTELLRAHGLHVQIVYADDSDIASFRDAARSILAEPRTFLVVNYDRRGLGQSGAGHISPIGAFSGETDRVLVLDVATYKYPYTWVPVSRLWTAIDTVDPDSGRSRGYLLVTPSAVSTFQRLDDSTATLSAARNPHRERVHYGDQRNRPHTTDGQRSSASHPFL
ncbi:MAG TPA: phytochelatin synthase family protein [Steroidobacteraceae bacterium]|nr:phytochelatin synthase family protein [Steroidobacteraceae bacterium]